MKMDKDSVAVQAPVAAAPVAAAPVAQAQPVPTQDQLYTLSFTREELIERIKFLEESENVKAFIKVQKGAQEADELQKLIQLVERQ